MNDEQIEQLVQERELTAPRVTKEQIDALMKTVGVQVTRIPGTNTTMAVASFPDGFMLGTGVSYCVSDANFDADLGNSIAGNKAVNAARDKLWELEGYLLRDRLRMQNPNL